jgi:hypothetical protein
VYIKGVHQAVNGSYPEPENSILESDFTPAHPLPHTLYKNITHVSRPLSDIRTIASLKRRAIMNGAIYMYSHSVPKGKTMIHSTGNRTVLKMNQRPHKQKQLYNCVFGTKYTVVILRKPRNLSKPHTKNVKAAHLKVLRRTHKSITTYA